MNRTRTSTLLMTSTLALGMACFGLASCNKDRAGSAAPEGPSSADTSVTKQPTEPALPPQDGPPAELTQIRAAWVNGDFQAVIESAEVVLPTLEGDTKVRARVWVASWLALAHAHEFPQNARPHAELAVRESARLAGDGDAVAISHYALAAVLVGEQHHEDAQRMIEKGAAAGRAEAEVGKLVLAEALLNQSFDDEDRLVDKSKMELARTQYAELATASSDPVIRGRAQVGVAATSKFLGDKAKLCEMVRLAQKTYEGSSASAYLTELPAMLADEAKCK